ncbi:MAG: methionine--tRNA ligase subunit beta [Candidatus Micrarchaeia archaeon]
MLGGFITDIIDIEEFKKADLRVGKIVKVEPHQQAKKPMYIITVDLGEELGTRTIVAGIREQYGEEELVGKLIVCVANLKPKNVAGVESQGMLLAAEDDGIISLLTPNKEVRPGSKIR